MSRKRLWNPSPAQLAEIEVARQRMEITLAGYETARAARERRRMADVVRMLRSRCDPPPFPRKGAQEAR